MASVKGSAKPKSAGESEASLKERKSENGLNHENGNASCSSEEEEYVKEEAAIRKLTRYVIDQGQSAWNAKIPAMLFNLNSIMFWSNLKVSKH